MAVIYETMQDGTVHAYSDQGLMIHGGFPEGDYSEAYDPVDAHRTYVEVEGQYIPTNPGEHPVELSKRKLMNALKARNLWDAVKSYMTSTEDLWDQWDASTTLDYDDELIRNACDALKIMLGLTDADITEILNSAII